MSDSKPCPALERNQGLIEVCANCPNRKPVSLEGLAKQVAALIVHGASDGFGRGINTAYRNAIRLIDDYENKELNNG
jgi:hypothetical protein